MTSAENLSAIVASTRHHLETRTGDRGVDHILKAIDETPTTPSDAAAPPPCPPQHEDALNQALAAMPGPTLGAIADAIQAARHDINWGIDDGRFYEPGSDVGDGYRYGNMSVELIGARGTAFHSSELSLGLFLLAPRVLYRDHNHPAAELYVNLTGPTGWRFGVDDAWSDREAGSTVWNPPNAHHATRVYCTPFLSVYAWTGDIDIPCRVIPADDWAALEQAL